MADNTNHHSSRVELNHVPEPAAFQNAPLTTPTSIRLVQMLPSHAGAIRCKLITIDLEQEPRLLNKLASKRPHAGSRQGYSGYKN